MLNNRQNGRRRGRGRTPNNNGGGQRNESRIDNRARGNAPQMLEKYKNLARDAQLSGDRVMTEYYLQFADHYFRIVSESRVRFEEQRRQRDDWRDEGDEGEDFDGMMRGNEDGGDEEGEEAAPAQRQRQDRGERQDRGDRQDRGNRGEQAERQERAERAPREARRDTRPQRTPRPVSDDHDSEGVADGFAAQKPVSTIDVAVLPPSLGVMADAIPDLDDEPAPTPKRRGRPRKVAAEDASAEG